MTRRLASSPTGAGSLIDLYRAHHLRRGRRRSTTAPSCRRRTAVESISAVRSPALTACCSSSTGRTPSRSASSPGSSTAASISRAAIIHRPPRRRLRTTRSADLSNINGSGLYVSGGSLTLSDVTSYQAFGDPYEFSEDGNLFEATGPHAALSLPASRLDQREHILVLRIRAHDRGPGRRPGSAPRLDVDQHGVWL